MAVLVGALLMALTWMAAKTQRRPAVTGAEAMIGTIALAKTDVAPRGAFLCMERCGTL